MGILPMDVCTHTLAAQRRSAIAERSCLSGLNEEPLTRRANQAALDVREYTHPRARRPCHYIKNRARAALHSAGPGTTRLSPNPTALLQYTQPRGVAGDLALAGLHRVHDRQHE